MAVKNNDLLITLKNKKNEKSVKENNVSFIKTLKDYGVDPAKVKIEITNTGGSELLTTILIQIVLPLLLILFFFWLLSRQARQSASQTFNFTQSLAKSILPKSKSESKKKKATLKDVAGLKEAKEELQEVIDFLRFPEKYHKMGARIPRGVILIGPPGCGKTLLARAVAGESNVPFFHISGSEFVELFVGVGASRVRNTFNLAKKHSPSILFIDEIDAIGRQRGAGIGGGNDEREQTLNQILVEMDGFTPETKTIVLAATNRPDVLDPALLRPGRFDRRIVIDLPDINEREAILKIHSQQKPLAKDVNLRVVAERTPGFSGADLANLMNESAILATQKNKKEIGMNELLPSIEKVLLGPERKSRLLSQEEKKIAAYHEAGHALVAASLPHTDPVRKISIISRGQAAGYTLKLPTHDKYLKSRAELIEELSVLLGGYTAERLV
ncbi:MAG TPA: ATP-dependent zinc metalloprotease FtsH, partial [Candidatus Portnoybacteria bacterium]|nr:ATP-dependent zinc metalloprotease FtsH [Candidatus Portnoybacteria bacterium]